MSFEVESSKSDDEDFSCGLLLRDIEEISKALYMHKSPHEAYIAKAGISESKSDIITHDKDKKSSIWKWKPLKALTHIRSQRFNCCFFLHVHTIEGLPPNFNNLDLQITWKRKADNLQTRPSRVSLGMAEFEETLMHKCTVYVGRNGPHTSAKYEPKLFLLQASVVGQPTLDIGSRWIDLSRLLPLTMEDLEGEKGKSGKWTTSFNLTGKAKGATLNVSFGFSLLSGDSFVPDVVRERELNHFADFEMNSKSSQLHSLTSVNSNFLEEIFRKKGSELPVSIALLYQKFDEGKSESLQDPIPESSCGISGNQVYDSEFNVNDEGIKVTTKDQIGQEKCSSLRFDNIVIETIDVAEIFAGEEAAFDEENHEQKDNDTCIIEHEPPFEELYSEDMDSFLNTLSLDDDSIENDFLNMLGVDLSQDDMDSDSGPHDDLLKLFEEEPLDSEQNESNSSCCTTPTGFRKVAFAGDFDLSLSAQSIQSFRNKRNAEVLEDLETEALMNEWGLSEKAFQYSPRVCSGGFGSPVYTPLQEPLGLPSIEEGLGPIVQTKDGGFLRSMSPLLFKNANNCARLIMQVSAPVVLPSTMGVTIMEMLQIWASVGVEKMCFQANELMPLEDFTGKTIQQFLADGESSSDSFNRLAMEQESDAGIESIDSDYVSLKDLVPMVLTNIEGLLVEGLKIQSGMPDLEASSSIRIQLSGNSASYEKSADELIKYSVPLEEFLRLDSRECEDNNLGNEFTMGLKVQLRDPLRNHEMVGSAMLALVHVQRVYFEQNKKKIFQPMFKVSEAHLAGLSGIHGNKPLWGTNRQQQSGSRWLLSSGLAKPNKKNQISNFKSVVKLKSSSGLMRKALQEDVLWSIAFPTCGEAGMWNDQIALNVHVRNPDIVFPTESVK